jgi:membrane protease YdiL (CAAX protease family)
MEPDSPTTGQRDGALVLQSVLGALAVVAGAFLLSNVVGALTFALTGVESLEALQARAGLYSVFTALASAGFIVAAVGYLAIRDEWELLHVRAVRLRDVAFVAGGVVALALAAAVTNAVVTVLIDVVESLFGVSVEFGTNTVIETGRSNPTYFLYMIPVALLVVGPGEELVFRGVVQGLFRRVVGVAPAVVLASCLFGLGHLSAISSGSAWPYVFVTVALGVVLGAIYEYTENIAVPAAIHGLWNAGIFALQWAAATNALGSPF